MLERDGSFVYYSDRMSDPSEAVFINHIVADHTIHDVVEEFDGQGRFLRITGSVGPKI